MTKIQHENANAMNTLPHSAALREARVLRVLAAYCETARTASTKRELGERILNLIGQENISCSSSIIEQHSDGTFSLIAVSEGTPVKPLAMLLHVQDVRDFFANTLRRQKTRVLERAPHNANIPNIFDHVPTKTFDKALLVPFGRGALYTRILLLFSDDNAAFHEEECALLRRLADNMAHSAFMYTTTSELNELEKAYETSKELYRCIFDSSPLAFITWEPTGIVVDWNKGAETYFGWRKDEVRGKDLMPLLVDDYHSKPLSEQRLILLSYLVPAKTSEHTRKDGSTFVCEWKNEIVYDSDGDFKVCVSIGNDITERLAAERKRKEQELMLRQAEKLAALGELAAGIAHEINQPLTGIALATENMLYSAEGRTHFSPKEDGEKILSYVDRIRTVIENIRLFSREQTETECYRFDVYDAIRNALSLVGTQYRAHGITITPVYSEETLSVFGNLYKLEQVILNLLSNARDALDEREEQEGAYDRRIMARAFHEGVSVVIEIEDNGVGIAEENMGNIMNPFFTTKPVGKGTGLGLSVSYGIITEMAGTLSFTHAGRHGTIARITLPAYTHEEEVS